MYRVRIYQCTESCNTAVYDKTVKDVDHLHGDTWLLNIDGKDIYIRPAVTQLLVIEQL